jgi:Ku protein
VSARRRSTKAAAASRPLWTGWISFGLVHVPVALYSATQSKHVAFHQLERKSGERIHYRRIRESDEREVEREDLVKGYELAKGRYVKIEAEELRALAPESTREIEIERFVELAEIDPIVWEHSYYLGPADRPGAAKAYELLRRTLLETGKVAIGRLVMRRRSYLATIRPFGEILALETMDDVVRRRAARHRRRAAPAGAHLGHEARARAGAAAGRGHDRDVRARALPRHVPRARARADRAEGARRGDRRRAPARERREGDRPGAGAEEEPGTRRRPERRRAARAGTRTASDTSRES